MTPDLLAILNRLHDSRVDFVIVGGVAAALFLGLRVEWQPRVTFLHAPRL